MVLQNTDQSGTVSIHFVHGFLYEGYVTGLFKGRQFPVMTMDSLNGFLFAEGYVSALSKGRQFAVMIMGTLNSFPEAQMS